MPQVTIDTIDYQPNSESLFERFIDLEQAIFLDSASPWCEQGRYDIITASPVISVKKNHSNTAICRHHCNYFSELESALEEHLPAVENPHQLPFVGGAAGFFGYGLEQPAAKHGDTPNLDDAAVGLYSWAVIVDHAKQRSALVSHPCINASLLKDIRLRLKSTIKPDYEKFRLSTCFESNMRENEYRRTFDRIQDYISAGDCYQINLAQRFAARFEGSPWQAYRQLRKTAAAPFSAYLQLGDQAILSVSPERFVQLAGSRVSTSPIKGTIARGSTPAADAANAEQLRHSSKDKAENLMIVDLLRNDLGKSCVPGSIQVDKLFELQSFDTVHHLVSTVSGQLQPNKSALQLLEGCFPGGSITGAPKQRAMEIISELEVDARSAYCGAIGYISCDGQMDTNIAIRTMVCDQGEIYCWAGGGIVADSQWQSEYQECLDKVGKLLDCLETPEKMTV